MTRNEQQLREAAEQGSVASEYALLASLIALVVIAAVTLLGQEVNAIYSGMAAAL
jgi:Flp pilus assembly pilin Flp